MARIQLQLWLPVALWAAAAAAAASAVPAPPAEEDITCVNLLQTSTQLAAPAPNWPPNETGPRGPVQNSGAAVAFWIVVCCVLMILLLPIILNYMQFPERLTFETLKANAEICAAIKAGEDGAAPPAFDTDVVKAAKFRTTLMDTYLIGAGLLCTVSASCFFIDNRVITSFTEGTEEAVSLRFALRTEHQLLLALATAMGLYSFVTFMLCSTYSRAAICRSYANLWLYMHVLEVTKKARSRAFFAMFVTAAMIVLSLLVHAVSNNVMTSKVYIMHSYVDAVSAWTGLTILTILVLTLFEGCRAMRLIALIFLPEEELKRIFGNLKTELLEANKPIADKRGSALKDPIPAEA